MNHYERLLDRAQRETDPVKLARIHEIIEKEKLKEQGRTNRPG